MHLKALNPAPPNASIQTLIFLLYPLLYPHNVPSLLSGARGGKEEDALESGEDSFPAGDSEGTAATAGGGFEAKTLDCARHVDVQRLAHYCACVGVHQVWLGHEECSRGSVVYRYHGIGEEDSSVVCRAFEVFEGVGILTFVPPGFRAFGEIRHS